MPEDLAIVGYDDIDFAAAAAVPLSSVRQPREQLGRAAAELLLEEANRARPARAPARGVPARAGGARVDRGPPAPTRDGVLMRIALFITCLADALYPRVGRATVTLLERLGHEVVFPPAQTCCGQMHVNTGYQRGALPLVRHHVEVFASSDVDAIVAPSGSCVGSVRHQHAMVARRAGDEPRRAGRGGRGQDVRAVGVPGRRARASTDVGAYFPHRVTYHPTCHSLRMLRVGDKPLRLLRQVRGHRRWWSCPRPRSAAGSAARSR